MRRRLLVATVAVVMVLLGLLEVPLAVTYARRERDTFDTDVQRDAAAFAVVSAEIIESPANHDVSRLAGRFSRSPGEIALVVDRAGHRLTPRRADDAAAFAHAVARARMGTATHGERRGMSYAAVPVGDADDHIGAVLLARPNAEVGRRVRRFLVLLAGLAAAVLGAALFLASRFGRWVVEPLRRLDDSAAALGAGDLSVRADEAEGPHEVAALAKTFNAMAARLDELVASQRRFVADASHQLRTPLTALRLRLENLDADDASGVLSTREAALRETTRLSRIVDGLLSLARAEGQRVERADLDVARIVSERRDVWAPLATERGVDIVADVASDTPLLARLGVGQLEQILDNLIDNALDASPDGTTLTLRAAAVGRRVEAHVIDQGRGMTHDERRHAFDAFWRSAVRADGGTGLGLAIADQLVRANDGTIVLQQGEGGGVDAVVSFERLVQS
jgi:signal transduction histidine kinase